MQINRLGCFMLRWRFILPAFLIIGLSAPAQILIHQESFEAELVEKL